MSNDEEVTLVSKVSPASFAKTLEVKSEPEHVEYRVLVNLSYDGKQVPAGDVVSDIPKSSIGWLLDGNYIEKVS